MEVWLGLVNQPHTPLRTSARGPGSCGDLWLFALTCRQTGKLSIYAAMTGASREWTERLDPGRIAAMHATMGHAGPPPGEGDPLPAFWQYLCFWDPQPASLLGRDGHPKTGEFIPDLGLPRRMWAGGKLDFLAPLVIGAETRKRSVVAQVDLKEGRSGKLGLVTLEHEYSQGRQTCLIEEQRLIYRQEATADAPTARAPMAPDRETVCQTRKFSTTDLFRYSALTFNGHRIHYDRDYAAQVEGYPGLIVHGPLLAQGLIDLAVGMLGDLAQFEFRATAPLFDHEEVAFCADPDAKGLRLWARGPDGRMCMEASASAP